MRILATLLNAHLGRGDGVRLFDLQQCQGNPPGHRLHADFFGVYDDMKVIEYLEFFAAAYRIQGQERKKKCDQVLELVDLGYKRDASSPAFPVA